METKCRIGQFNGMPIFQIYRVRANGELEPKPRIAFGVKKAKLILDNIDAIREWADSETEQNFYDLL